MGRVHLLPEDLASKIAAGEVVERPASVVKELVENALDAGAGSVEVHLEKAGGALIRVRDDGCGIAPDDLERLFRRHATSKIASAADLDAISSLGFRGEALYSVAAVADVVLRTTVPDAESGWEIRIRGGERAESAPCAPRRGTEIEVRELFFNTPGRRKFLRSETAELRQIVAVVLPYAVARPDVRFLVSHGNRTLLDVSPDAGRTVRFARAVNVPVSALREAAGAAAGEPVRVAAVLGNADLRRPRRDTQFVFVNGRPVESRAVSFAANQAYRLIFPAETYPVFAVFLDVPPAAVDVNVHPTKREVRIRDEYRLCALVRQLCETTLMEGPTVRAEIGPARPPESPGRPETEGGVAEPVPERLLFAPGPPGAGTGPIPRTDSLRGRLAGARFIGPLMGVYLLFEAPGALLIMDQHAAHERVVFERLRKQMAAGAVEVQRLLSPFLIRLSPAEAILWAEGRERLERIGFETAPWDTETVAIHSHPRLIANPEAAVRGLLAGENLSACDDDALARRACRQSVMAGEAVTAESAAALCGELLACADPFTCPHGRPTVIEMDERQLVRQFLRG